MSKLHQVIEFAKEHGTSSAAAWFNIRESTVERYMRTYRVPIIQAKERVIGVIADTHCPFDIEQYPAFCKEKFDKYGVTDVVHVGDLVDNHAISRHLSEPDAMGAVEEYEATLKRVKRYTDLFPKATLCLGNHCSIPTRQAALLGMPKIFMCTEKEVWNLPDEWDIVESIIIDGVLYKHGIGAGGKSGAINSAIRNRMSVVQGHTHAHAGVTYNANSSSLIFGMNVGAAINTSAYAFRYGKHIENKPIAGCGIVYGPSKALYIPMEL